MKNVGSYLYEEKFLPNNPEYDVFHFNAISLPRRKAGFYDAAIYGSLRGSGSCHKQTVYLSRFRSPHALAVSIAW